MKKRHATNVTDLINGDPIDLSTKLHWLEIVLKSYYLQPFAFDTEWLALKWPFLVMPPSFFYCVAATEYAF